MAMIKVLRASVAAFLLTAAMSDGAMALSPIGTCATGADGTNSLGVTLSNASLSAISGKIACMAPSGGNYSNTWGNQEQLSGSSIVELSTGSTIGSWSLSGSLVSFVYTSGGSYNYTVYGAADTSITAGTYFFCPQPSGGTAYKVVIKTSGVNCG
jgi:hypothetical protein